jgi:hypothetical protein
MRVYELAKKLQTSSSEVLKQASALGLEADSVLTKLEPSDAKKLQDVFAKREKSDESSALATKLAEKREKAASVSRESLKAERDVLERNRARAHDMDSNKRGTRSAGSRTVALPEKPIIAVATETPALTDKKVAQKETDTKPLPVVKQEPVAVLDTSAPAEEATPETAEQAADGHAGKQHAADKTKNAASKQPRRPLPPPPEEELDPEEVLAAPFIGRFTKTESSKNIRAIPQKDKDAEAKRLTPAPPRPTFRASRRSAASAAWTPRRPDILPAEGPSRRTPAWNWSSSDAGACSATYTPRNSARPCHSVAWRRHG